MEEAIVVVLKSPFTGSNNQLVSLSEHLCPGFKIEMRRITLRRKSTVALLVIRAVIFLKCFFQFSPFWNHRINRIFLKGDIDLRGVKYIIGKRSTYEHTLALLTTDKAQTSVFVGEQKKIKPRFDIIVSSSSTPAHNADINLDYLPTANKYSAFLEEKKKLDPSGENWAVLFGGNTQGFDYQEEDWIQALHNILYLAKKSSVALVVTTSPRSPKALEKLIPEILGIDRENRHLFYRYEDPLSPSLLKILAMSTAALVTEDSAAMLADVVNCRLPAVSIRPDDSSYNSLSTPQVSYLEKQKRLVRTTIKHIPKLDMSFFITNTFSPTTKCWTEKIVEFNKTNNASINAKWD